MSGRDRPPELGDLLSRIAEPAPWELGELGDLWAKLTAAVPRPIGAVLMAPASTVLDWSIGPGPRPSNTSRLTRTLYAPDNPNQRTLSDGKDVEALKRMVARAGFWKWQEFDRTYSNAFAHGATGPTGSGPGVDGLRAALGTGDGSGTLNERTYHALLYGLVPEGAVHAGEWICDAYAESLLEEYHQAWLADNPPPKSSPGAAGEPESGDSKKARIRKAMADYCRRSISSEPGIHYQQARPIACFGVPPENGFTTDCSGHSTCVYYWARKQTGVAVPDPNGSGYNGYGYTGTLINNPRCSPKYLVGDLGIYGTSTSNTTHVVTCYAEGDGGSSRWCSHGSEAAPYAVELHYRDDLVAVVRPPLLP